MKEKNMMDDFQEWVESLENIILSDGDEYASELLNKFFVGKIKRNHT